uniref:Immunoglobulin domain-containing protein n=1 Tax=Astatotilapia calliptera TaxID=8154 RepID=A0A3P8Q5T9_ASTCA
MMRSFVLSTALFLSSLSWISVSGSEFQTMEVQLDEEVTLKCSNISSHPTQTDWFKVINRTKPSCIAAMYGSQGKASFCDGFRNGKFNMSSNNTSVFLKITQVDLSDVGLYFCGFYVNKHTVISNAVELRIQGGETNEGEGFKTEKESDRMTHLLSTILGSLAGLLTIVVIILVFKIWKLQKVAEQEPKSNKNVSSDDLNYAALNFQKNVQRNRRPVTQRELEPHVVYAATR